MQRRTALSVATLAATPLLASLSACGFALRKAPDFDFKTLFTNFSPNSSLGNQFKRSLVANGDVRIISDASQIAQADVLLDVLLDQRQKVVVGISSTGQVREFQLRLIFKFRLRRRSDGADLIPETELTLQRDQSFNEAAALSKEAEEGLLYRDMQNDVVNQLLRRLATIRVG